MNSTGPPDSTTLVVDDHEEKHHRLYGGEEQEQTGVDNPAFQDNGDLPAPADSVDSTTSVVLGSHGGLADLRLDGEIKDKEVAEAVNLELVNMNPNNGNGIGLNGIPVKKEPGEDTSEGYADPYDEYFVPVNEHRKYMSPDRPRITFVLPESVSSGVDRAGLSVSEPLEGVVDYHEWMQKSARGEKLYVTKDKRRGQSWSRLILMAICCVVVTAVVVIGALAATGVILSQQEAIVGDAAITSRQFSGSSSPVLDDESNDVLPEVSSYSPPPHISHEPAYPPSTEMNQYYVPRVLDGEFVIDNMEFDPELARRDSNQFQMLASTLEDELKKALFDYQSLHYGAADISMKILQFSPGSVVVKFRIGWQFKSGIRNPPDPIQKDDVRMKLEDYLQQNEGYLHSYHLPTASIRAGYVIDMCQFNNGQCSNDCTFDYKTVDFQCSCPPGQALDATGKNCTVENHQPENEIQESVSEPLPITEIPVPKHQPSTYMPIPRTDISIPEPHPGADVQETEPQPITDVPVAEPQPVTDVPIAKSQPIFDVPVAEPQPNTDVPVAEPQPVTDVPVAEPQPVTDVPVAEPQPVTDVPVAEPQPVTDVPVAEPQPVTDVPVAEPQPVTDVPVAEPQPVTDVPVAEPQPVTDVPVAEPQPVTDVPVAEPQPVTDVPVAEPQPVTDVPVAEPQPVTDVPVAELQPVTHVPVAEPQPITDVPVAEPQPVTDMPVAEPQPVTDVPVAEPQPITDVPIAEPQPITDVPIAEPQPITDVPVAEPQPVTDVPVAEPQPITDVPVAEPQPITDVPIAEPQPVTNVPLAEPLPSKVMPKADLPDLASSTEVSLSKPLSSTKLPTDQFGPSSDSLYTEGMSNTELTHMGLQHESFVQDEGNMSLHTELLLSTELPNEVPIDREFGQYHASVTENESDLYVTSHNFESKINNAIHSLSHNKSNTYHSLSSNSDTMENNYDSDITNLKNDKILQNTTSTLSDHRPLMKSSELNSSETFISEVPTTTEMLHTNSENNTETHVGNELETEYQNDFKLPSEIGDQTSHSESEISELEEMTTVTMGVLGITDTTEVSPVHKQNLDFIEKTSEDEALIKYHVDMPFNITNEVEGRQKTSRMESEDEILLSNGTQSDVNSTFNFEPPHLQAEMNHTFSILPKDYDDMHLENNIDDGINETHGGLGTNVHKTNVVSSEHLGNSTSNSYPFSNGSENNLNISDSDLAGNETVTVDENTTDDLITSADNNATLLSSVDFDNGIPNGKPQHEKEPLSQSMHTLNYGGNNSGEALNNTNNNGTSAEFDEKFRNIVEEPGFVLVNLTNENDVPEPTSGTTSSNELNEYPTEPVVPESDSENKLINETTAHGNTTEAFQNNVTNSSVVAEYSENRIKNTLSSEEDEHHESLIKYSNGSVNEELKKHLRLDDEMSMVNPQEMNVTHTEGINETLPLKHLELMADTINTVSNDTSVQNTTEGLEALKINETLHKDNKNTDDVTESSNDILSDHSNSDESHGLRQNTGMSKFNTSNNEVPLLENQNSVSGIAPGANISSGENDIDDIWYDHSNVTKQNASHFVENNSLHSKNIQNNISKYENASSISEYEIPMHGDAITGNGQYSNNTHVNVTLAHDNPASSSETAVAENDVLPIHGLDEPLAVIPLEESLENDSHNRSEGEILAAGRNSTVAENVTEFTEINNALLKANLDTLSSSNISTASVESSTASQYAVDLSNSSDTRANSLSTIPNPTRSENLTDYRGILANTGPENINIVSQSEPSSIGSDTSYSAIDSKGITEPKIMESDNITSDNKNDEDLHKFVSEDLENKLVNHVETNQATGSSTEHFGEVLRIPPSSDGNTIPPTSRGVSQEKESIVEHMTTINGSVSPQETPIDDTVLVDKANEDSLVDKTEVKKKDLSSVSNSKKANKGAEISSSDDEDVSTGKLANGIFDKKGKYDKDTSRKVEKIGVLDINEDVLNGSNNASIELLNVPETISDSLDKEQSVVDEQDENENALHVISGNDDGINNVGNLKESKREKKKSDKTAPKEVVIEKTLKPLNTHTMNGSTVYMTDDSSRSENVTPNVGLNFPGLGTSTVSSEPSFSYNMHDASIPVTTSAKENVIDHQSSGNGDSELLHANDELPKNMAAQPLKFEEVHPMQDNTSVTGVTSSTSTNSLTEQHTERALKDSVNPDMVPRFDDIAVKTVSTMPTITASDFTKLLAEAGITQEENGTIHEAASVTFSKCAAGQFQCTNGTSREGAYCVSLSAKCDSVNDCSDGSDEVGCMDKGCPGNFQCASGQCLKRHLVCNGIIDCNDGTDEVDCDQWKCLFDEFQCPSGRCIPVLWQCDGKPDCGNHTDEYNCQSTCGNDEFLCPELWCIPMTWRCNGIPECANGEDEKLCDCMLDQFKCNTGGCVRGSQVCDGVEHCPDSSDEWNCLMIQKDTNSLQIRSPDGLRHPVCGDYWDGNVSDLACRELGYGKSVFTDLSQQDQGNNTDLYYTLKPGSDTTQPSHQSSLLTMMATSSECASSTTVEISCQEFTCGAHSSADDMAARLVGGDKASSSQWPSVALMYHTAHKSSCTASIISPVWLLTSYNCLKSKDRMLSADTWVVFAGGSMFDMGKPDRQIREVGTIVPHPQVKFNQFVYTNDLALVRLNNPLTLTRYVSAVCLPEEEIEPRQLCVTAGWSYAAPGEINFSPYLNYLPIPTIELDICNSTKHYAGYIASSDICAGFMDARKSPCYNDEGAPLMCVSEGGVWELQGVLSYHGNCGRGEHPAIFSSVSSSRDWIEHTVGTHFEHKTAFNVRR